MFIFTTPDKTYAVIVAVFFSLIIGFHFYSNKVNDNVCSKFFNSSQCQLITNGGIILLAGIVIKGFWCFLPDPLRVYISLAAITPGGFPFYTLVSVLTYIETIKVLKHIQEVILIPLTLAQCLKNETTYSTMLIHNSSIFQETHVSDIHIGITGIATEFNSVNSTQHHFKNAIEIGFSWLESRGIGCQQVLTRPFEVCLKASEMAKIDCQSKGVGVFCEILEVSEAICKNLKILSNTTCQDLRPEKIPELFSSLRQGLSKMVSGAIRMRVGILFELHSSSHVEEELTNVWNSLLDIFKNGFKTIMYIFDLFLDFVLRYLSVLWVALWPCYYYCHYVWGPLSFDNFYVPQDDSVRRILSARLLQENKIQIVPKWLPTVKETGKMLSDLLLSVDQIVIVVILLINFYYTTWANSLSTKWMQLFQQYQNNLFGSSKNQSNLVGVAWIGQMVAKQLENLQDAIGLGRLLDCIHTAPPVNYTYNIFILAMLQRALYILVENNWRCLPSLICARFYRQQHHFRMKCLRSRILLADAQVKLH